MKWKKLMVLLCSAAMVCSLAACGSGKDGETAGGENAAEAAGDEGGAAPAEGGNGTTITFLTNAVGNKADALRAACEAFEEETGYTVDFQVPGEGYEELMKTKMAANELPDVFTTHGWSVARYSDYLMTVNDLEWAADISDQIRPVITDKDGNMFVLPVDMDIAGIICNMTVLEEAGVDPDGIQTWDDFAAACDKIKAAGKTPIHLGGKDNWTIGQYFDWAAPSFYITNEAKSHADELKGGTFDTAVWEEVSGMLADWVAAGYFNEDVLTADYNSDIQALAQADAAFAFYGNGGIVDTLGVNPDADMGMIPVPAVSADDKPSLISGEDIAVGVWKDSKVKAEATELLNYLARADVLKGLAEAAGNKAGLNGVSADVGKIGEYYDKYADVEAFPYFDREYLPSGMWDVMCSTGADILAQKDGAVENAAKTMEQNFNDKYVAE